MPTSRGIDELPDALARAGAQKGQPGRNPLGISNPRQRMRNRDIRELLLLNGDEPCAVPGYEHMTKMQFMVDSVWEEAMFGTRWAVVFICNRIFGRVPLNVEMEVTHGPDFSEMTREELLARLEQLRGQLADPHQVIDVTDVTGVASASIPDPPDE